MNGEHYLLLCDMLLQKQLEDLSKLSPQESFNSRQKILNLLWPKTHSTTNNHIDIENLSTKKLDPNSPEYAIYLDVLNARIDKNISDPNSQDYKEYRNIISSTVGQILNFSPKKNRPYEPSEQS
jgi:hypothetical protein